MEYLFVCVCVCVTEVLLINQKTETFLKADFKILPQLRKDLTLGDSKETNS